MRCPDCNAELEKIEYDDEVVYKCTNIRCAIEIPEDHLEEG